MDSSEQGENNARAMGLFRFKNLNCRFRFRVKPFPSVWRQGERLDFLVRPEWTSAATYNYCALQAACISGSKAWSWHTVRWQDWLKISRL